MNWRRLHVAHQHQIIEIGGAVLRTEDAVDAGVDFCPRPARELFEVAVHDDAESAIVAGPLLHAAKRIVEGVAKIAEGEGQALLFELAAQAADIGELAQIGG